MTDKKKLHFAAAVDKHGARMRAQKIMGLPGFEVFHVGNRQFVEKRQYNAAAQKPEIQSRRHSLFGRYAQPAPPCCVLNCRFAQTKTRI